MKHLLLGLALTLSLVGGSVAEAPAPPEAPGERDALVQVRTRIAPSTTRPRVPDGLAARLLLAVLTRHDPTFR